MLRTLGRGLLLLFALLLLLVAVMAIKMVLTPVAAAAIFGGVACAGLSAGRTTSDG